MKAQYCTAIHLINKAPLRFMLKKKPNHLKCGLVVVFSTSPCFLKPMSMNVRSMPNLALLASYRHPSIYMIAMFLKMQHRVNLHKLNIIFPWKTMEMGVMFLNSGKVYLFWVLCYFSLTWKQRLSLHGQLS